MPDRYSPHTPHTPYAPHAVSPQSTSNHQHHNSNHHDELSAEHERQRELDSAFAAQARAEAERLFDERSRILTDQKKAWDSGDHGLAKQLSAHAKQVGARAEEALAKAADVIFKHMNERRDKRQVDLHHLHVSEAVAFVQRRLEMEREAIAVAKAQNPVHITTSTGPLMIVIYGAGHHSAGHVQKLKPAVLDLLHEENAKHGEWFTYKEDYDAVAMKTNQGCVSLFFAGVEDAHIHAVATAEGIVEVRNPSSIAAAGSTAAGSSESARSRSVSPSSAAAAGGTWAAKVKGGGGVVGKGREVDPTENQNAQTKKRQSRSVAAATRAKTAAGPDGAASPPPSEPSAAFCGACCTIM
jgi:hypothetical protein